MQLPTLIDSPTPRVLVAFLCVSIQHHCEGHPCEYLGRKYCACVFGFEPCGCLPAEFVAWHALHLESDVGPQLHNWLVCECVTKYSCQDVGGAGLYRLAVTLSVFASDSRSDLHIQPARAVACSGPLNGLPHMLYYGQHCYRGTALRARALARLWCDADGAMFGLFWRLQSGE
jgi:hypothetical protein